MVSANREGIAVAAENEHMQIWPRERNAAGKGQRASVNVMGAVGLDKIRKPARATDAGDGGYFLVPHLALFDELEIQREHGEIAAARAPGGIIGN